MRRRAPFIVTFFTLVLFSTSSAAAAPVAWVDYSVLSHPVVTAESGNKMHITEIFWYGCSYCQEFEPLFESWIAQHSDQIILNRIPAPIGPNLVPGARVFYALKDLGILPDFHEKFLAAVHADDVDVTDQKSIVSWFVSHGIDRTSFEAAYNSERVTKQVEHAKQEVLGIEVTSIPSLVIDGKYLTSSRMARGYTQVLKVTDFLISKARSN
ncbi:MAG TPA: thiol:disulfide interchange protein DsbA/DsbL [Spirochaetia bacterium]|nr:thiol:disulfide interchange protein DsbA/DsbL [Spirochaetia bacterium]